jgi:hypothetical protein
MNRNHVHTVTHRGLRLLDGTFYTVQRADIKPLIVDQWGNQLLEWPARSVYSTLELADHVAQQMAAQHKEYPFVVMKSVAAYAAERQPIPIARRKL